MCYSTRTKRDATGFASMFRLKCTLCYAFCSAALQQNCCVFIVSTEKYIPFNLKCKIVFTSLDAIVYCIECVLSVDALT